MTIFVQIFVAISRSVSCEVPRVSLSNESSRNFLLIGLNFSAFKHQNRARTRHRINRDPPAIWFKFFLTLDIIIYYFSIFYFIVKIVDIFNIGVGR